MRYVGKSPLGGALDREMYVYRTQAYCGLLSVGCGHEVSWEIPGVAYSPVYFRLKGQYITVTSTPPQSINPAPAFSRDSFVPQPNLPARIFLLRLLTADDWVD
jgi:hypothetical protein